MAENIYKEKDNLKKFIKKKIIIHSRIKFLITIENKQKK